MAYVQGLCQFWGVYIKITMDELEKSWNKDYNAIGIVVLEIVEMVGN